MSIKTSTHALTNIIYYTIILSIIIQAVIQKSGETHIASKTGEIHSCHMHYQLKKASAGSLIHMSGQYKPFLGFLRNRWPQRSGGIDGFRVSSER